MMRRAINAGPSVGGIRIKKKTLLQGYHSFNIPATALTPTITNGAVPNNIETATNDIMMPTLSFADGATTLKAQLQLQMPRGWDLSDLLVMVDWTANSAVANSVVWQLRAQSFADGDAMDAANWGATTAITDANGASAYTRRLSPQGTLAIGNSPAADDALVIEIFRDPTHASDNLAAAAELRQLMFWYRVNVGTDV